jgi:hypothetical protein
MSEDQFESYRHITFVLPFELWEKMRAFTFKRKMSYRRFYEEFTRLIINNDPMALKLVEQIMVSDAITMPGRAYTKSGGALDNETIYDILAKEGVV